jgi:hypothetical protein
MTRTDIRPTATYLVTRYTEAPEAPEPAVACPTLAAARREVRHHLASRADRTLAGERYEDGTTHVEAYYEDHHRSAGYWICRCEAVEDTETRPDHDDGEAY